MDAFFTLFSTSSWKKKAVCHAPIADAAGGKSRWDFFRLIHSKGTDESIPAKIILESKVVVNS